jgi:hypothetical protein
MVETNSAWDSYFMSVTKLKAIGVGNYSLLSEL